MDKKLVWQECAAVLVCSFLRGFWVSSRYSTGLGVQSPSPQRVGQERQGGETEDGAGQARRITSRAPIHSPALSLEAPLLGNPRSTSAEKLEFSTFIISMEGSLGVCSPNVHFPRLTLPTTHCVWKKHTRPFVP